MAAMVRDDAGTDGSNVDPSDHDNYGGEADDIEWGVGQTFGGRVTGVIVGLDAEFRWDTVHNGTHYEWAPEDQTTMVPAHQQPYRDALRRLFQRRSVAEIFRLQASASREDQDRAVSFSRPCIR